MGTLAYHAVSKGSGALNTDNQTATPKPITLIKPHRGDLSVNEPNTFNASFPLRVLRSLVSFLPSKDLYHLRRLKEMATSGGRRPHEQEFQILNYLSTADGCVVDVGGNRGQTIRSVRLFAPDSHIVSFEPNPRLNDRLRKLFQT